MKPSVTGIQIQSKKQILIMFFILTLVGMGCSTNNDDPAPVTGVTFTLDANNIKFEAGKLVISGSVNTPNSELAIVSKGVTYSTTTSVMGVSFSPANSGVGDFSITISDLNFKNTYYLSAYCIFDLKGVRDTTYGSQMVFNGLAFPGKISVTSAKPDSIIFSVGNFKLNKTQGLEGIQARGICWSLSANPVYNSSSILFSNSDTLGFDGFSAGLVSGSVYYFRSFVINLADTAYSSNVVVSTAVKDFENNQYQTILIGDQLWMQSNLKSLKFRNGDILPDTTYLISNKDGYGNYYRKYVINNDLCPAGWHVPVRQDWNELFTSLGGWDGAGLKLKDSSNVWGVSPVIGQGVSKFRAIPTGQLDTSGIVKLEGSFGYWWTKANGTDQNIIWVNNLNDAVYSGYLDASKRGFPVRCLKDK